MNAEIAAALWSRFLAAGQRLQQHAPELWPLVVDLIEGAAEPDLLTAENLQEIIGDAMSLVLNAPEPAPPPSITPDETLIMWRLVDPDAIDIEFERVALLDPGSLAEIHTWASMVVAARRDEQVVVPPRPPVAEQLLAEAELAARIEVQ